MSTDGFMRTLSGGDGGAAGMQRQTAVVLVVDVVESVRLMQTDEASVVQRWSQTVHQVRDVILPRRHGRLVKSLGDGDRKSVV